MHIIAVNGSHRKGQNTTALLKAVLEEAVALGATTELLELTDYNIKHCLSCNKCMGRPQCTITDDDMAMISEKLLAADGIVLGSPVYFANVSTLMKNFMDRTRPLHLTKNMLAGKVGGAVTIAGLRSGGQEFALRIMECFLIDHGLYVVDSRNQDGPIMSDGVVGTLMADVINGKPVFRKNVQEDEYAILACRQLASNMVKLIQKIG